jgi:DnaJ-domain-containing protein 1
MPANPFGFFDLDPAPGLDADALKERFARLTAETHPDKFQQAPEPERLAVEGRYAEMNRAYQTLIDPRQRLLALYELTKDLFIEVGQTCQNVDAYLERKRSAGGALERAALMGEELTLQDALMTLAGKLEKLRVTLETELTALDTSWRSGHHDLNALETAYRKYSYLARWRQQLEEREMALLTGE